MRGLLGLLGAFLLHVLIGAINRWGMINSYVTSFFKLTADPHIETNVNCFVVPLTMFCAGATMKWGFRRCGQFGLVQVMSVSVVGMAGCSFVASLAEEFACTTFVSV